MANESRNLTLRRSTVNIWEQPGWTPDTSLWDRERVLMGIWGGGLALYGIRRGGWLGSLLAAAGAGLVARAWGGRHDLSRAQSWTERLARGWRQPDVVGDASEESFPASDAPSWTPTAGATTRHRG